MGFRTPHRFGKGLKILFAGASGTGKDVHDRYATIQVAYLLQRMEEYDSVVILASNLSKNIDEAFSRRMHYVVEFPLPDESHPELLWRGMFSPEEPLCKEVDFRFLDKQFFIAGGDIRKVALDATFLAAQDGQAVTMNLLIKAMAWQMMKKERIPSPTNSKRHVTRQLNFMLLFKNKHLSSALDAKPDAR